MNENKKKKIQIVIITSLFLIAGGVSLNDFLNIEDEVKAPVVKVVKHHAKSNNIKKIKEVKKGSSDKKELKEVVKKNDKPLSPLDSVEDADTFSKMFRPSNEIKNNPFRVNLTVDHTQMVSNVPRVQELRVTAIGINKDSSMAIINNKLYKIGDMLYNHYKLSEIKMAAAFIVDPTGKKSALPLY